MVGFGGIFVVLYRDYFFLTLSVVRGGGEGWEDE